MKLNCTELFLSTAKDRPNQKAIGFRENSLTFSELIECAERVQSTLQKRGFHPGDPVLLMDSLSPELYAIVLAVLALGGTILFVEPWMKVQRISEVIRSTQPKYFIASRMGQLWGLRLKEVREIPHWITPHSLFRTARQPFSVERVEPQHPGILTFTSGTTGAPKGVSRQQGYLVKQFEVFSKNLHLGKFSGPDLCIFANFTLANLAGGRTTLLLSAGWKPRELDGALEQQPETVTAGPGFMLRLLERTGGDSLKEIHVGGALTDCAIFENIFQKYPQANVLHLYGSSEAEPVSLADAREAVRLSKERGLFQTLFLGTPVEEISATCEPDTVWVAGEHVCPRYVANEEENRLNKRLDANGRVWHRMGDRIAQCENGWWYHGRASQTVDDFLLEQRIYSALHSSKSFVHRTDDGKRLLVGEGIAQKQDRIRFSFHELDGVIETAVVRDKRHRSRLDRTAMLAKGVLCAG